ncbi:heterokaryon incompatibility protein-domain-containing protein [Aspergillus unguis]
MYRWHESSCRRPDVSIASGLPSCHYCFAISLLEEQPIVSQPPLLRDRDQMNLSWPSAVTYSNCKAGETRENDHEKFDFASDSIRLLRLKPGTGDEPLHAEFETVRINQTPLPRYEAVSYTSDGDGADSTCPVYIGDYWDVAYVSANCGKALRRFRQRKGERWLWVDALCRTQEDSDEKSAQVHMLREIYSRAIKVLAYVGDEQTDFGPAFMFLKDTTSSLGDRNVQTSLSMLLEQPYFSRLWTIQETLMARELEIFCGSLSARWPRHSLETPEVQVPSWLLKDPKWFPFSGRDLFSILMETSQYQCSDPRDKVFAVLGLLADKTIRPDYTLPVESVYIGIAAYIIQKCQTMDLLALAGQNKMFSLPSWVPDWSQSLSLPCMDSFSRLKKDELGIPHRNGSLHIKFNCGHSSDIEESRAMCEITPGLNCSAILEEDSLYLYLINTARYTTDSLFLVNGYNYPLILREIHKDIYTLVSPCVLSISAPSRRNLVAWYRRPTELGTALGLEVSALTPEDDRSLQELHSRLIPLQSDTPQSTIRTRVLSFLMLPHTAIGSIEHQLREEWTRYSQILGWMFTDQSAIWQFLREIHHLPSSERTGRDRLTVHGPNCFGNVDVHGVFSADYTWDLARFCWSFLQPTDTAGDPPELQWSPMVNELRARREDIAKWAQTTEKLFKVFEYTDTCLGEAWASPFPGSDLPQLWTSRENDFLAGPGSSLADNQMEGAQQAQQAQQRPHLSPEHLWSMSGFEAQMQERKRIWDVAAVEGSSVSRNVKAHALLYYLGLDLCNEVRVDII